MCVEAFSKIFKAISWFWIKIGPGNSLWPFWGGYWWPFKWLLVTSHGWGWSSVTAGSSPGVRWPWPRGWRSCFPIPSMGRVWYIYLHECLILMVNHVGIHIRTSPMDACYEYRKNVKLRLGNPIGFFRVSQVGDLEIRYCLGCLNEWYSNRLFNLILTRTFYRVLQDSPVFTSCFQGLWSIINWLQIRVRQNYGRMAMA